MSYYPHITPFIPPLHSPSGGPASSVNEHDADPLYLKRICAKFRPEDWRSDYDPPSSSSTSRTLAWKNVRAGTLFPLMPYSAHSMLARAELLRSSQWSGAGDRTIHPLILHSPLNNHFVFDLRDTHSYEDHFGAHSRDPRLSDKTILSAPAAEPSAAALRIYHPLLPWYIDVQFAPDSNTPQIMLRDLMDQMLAQLSLPIRFDHYWNEELDDTERRNIDKAFHRRRHKHTGWSSPPRSRIRLDFLSDEVIFNGFVKGKDGMWELKTKKPESNADSELAVDEDTKQGYPMWVME